MASLPQSQRGFLCLTRQVLLFVGRLDCVTRLTWLFFPD